MSMTIVHSGALQMALNVLRRAGKTEVADALEEGAVRLSTTCVRDVLTSALFESTPLQDNDIRKTQADYARVECPQCCALEGEPCRDPKTRRYFAGDAHHESRAGAKPITTRQEESRCFRPGTPIPVSHAVVGPSNVEHGYESKGDWLTWRY